MNWWKIAGVSFLILFLELLIIRLLGTEIRIFAYLGNLVLLAIFVGSGLGMYFKKPLPLSASAVLFFLTAVLTTTKYILRTPRFDVKLFSGISELLSPLSESYIWQTLYTFSKTGAVFGLLLTGAILVLLAVSFMPLGNLLGRLLDNHPRPLRAYSVNIMASLAGMWAFQLFSLAEFPPLLGLVIGLAALFLLVEDRFERYFVVAVALITIAAVAPKISLQPYEGPTTFWSPYQKLTLSPIYPTKIQLPGGYYLEVNNTGYMGLLDLNDKHEASASAILVKNRFALLSELPFLNQYTLPYRFKPAPDNVLIIGAGAGNDANGAIRGGAKSIDAVEIDPVIIRLGQQYHPNQPYQNPAVNTVVADGRAFMEQTQIRYDLIVMGLADSHTLNSNLTNLRLDHYLYTRESLTRAREILKSDGILILSFEAPRPWIGQRLAKTVADAFGSPPVVFEVRSDNAFGWGGYFFVAAKDPDLLPRLLSEKPDLNKFIKAHERSFSPSTINPLSDDWPYLYLDKPRLPLIHILMGIFLTGTLLVVKSRFLRPSEFNLPMFLWGAAFLLFEFQNISKAGLLFGLTWQTNMIIITSVLLMILLANLAAEHKLLKPNLAFIGLIGSLGLQLIIPLYKFNQLSAIAKLIGAGTILNLPFFFGAVIFAYWFASAKNRSAAFASNLLGSAFGGLLEMMSFLTGIKSLLLVTIILYVLGWITASKKFGKIGK